MKTALTMSKYDKLPEFVNKMMENKWLGSKDKVLQKEGKDILTLDLDT
jgi:3-hydroxyacyl-CoA dehydrogenase